MLPHQPLEIIVAYSGYGTHRRPPDAASAAQGIRYFPNWGCEPLGVDYSKIASLDQSGTQYGLAVTHLSDQMGRSLPRNGARQGPTYQRYADPLGVGGFSDQQYF